MGRTLLEQTRSHYDRYPFIRGGGNRIDWWRDYLVDVLPTEEIEGRFIADIGSSVGEISRGLIDRGARLTCLDLSSESLAECRRLNPEAELLHGNALELPFPDESFDHTISIGVLHHTPDCRRGFRETARVTAPGGRLVVFLYNYWNIYNLVYHAFRPVRSTVPLRRVPRWAVRTMQPFAKSHLGQKLDDEQLRNLLGDKLWTPQATFHSVREVRRWGEECGLELLAVKRFYLGYANVILLKKNGSASPVSQELNLRCTRCGQAPMNRSERSFECTSCGLEYVTEGGIIRTLSEPA